MSFTKTMYATSTKLNKNTRRKVATISANGPKAFLAQSPYDLPPVRRAQLHRMYILNFVIVAANIMRSVEGTIPAFEKAMGRDSTPPPQTVATRPTMATSGEDWRVSQSCAG